MSETWRVGRKVVRTLYIGDQLVGLMDTPELAVQVVEAVNGEVHPAIRERRTELLARELYARYDRQSARWGELEGVDQRHWLRQARELIAIWVGGQS